MRHSASMSSEYSTSQRICTQFALCCVLLWLFTELFYPYPSGLLHWWWASYAIGSVPVKQPWRIWSSGFLIHCPQGYETDIWKVSFLNLLWQNNSLGTLSEIALGWMTQNCTVMCLMAPSHYLYQCWPSFMMPCGVTRPQWVNLRTTT